MRNDIRPNSSFGKTAAECRAIARDYETRGLTALAKTWKATAQRLDAQERKERRL